MLLKSFLRKTRTCWSHRPGHYHCCWWPGHARSQGIRSNGTELVLPEYFGFSTRGIQGLIVWSAVLLCNKNELGHKRTEALEIITGRQMSRFHSGRSLILFVKCKFDIWTTHINMVEQLKQVFGRSWVITLSAHLMRYIFHERSWMGSGTKIPLPNLTTIPDVAMVVPAGQGQNH